MKIWMVYGYFLTGTGSNLYVKNLCKYFCAMGHDVDLFCQDRDIDKQDYIEAAYSFDTNNSHIDLIKRQETIYPGKCTCYVPNIGEVLPVYVKDKYKGFDAQEIHQMPQEALERYIHANARALQSRLQIEKPDLIISNHAVLQPVYVKRALEGYEDIIHFNVIHGSALNFSVRKSDLATQYALEGLHSADGIVFLTEHSKKEFLEYFQGKALFDAKQLMIPAGVDIDRFIPLAKDEPKKDRIASMLKNAQSSGALCSHEEHQKKNLDVARLIADLPAEELKQHKESLMDKGNQKCIDADLGQKLLGIDWAKENILLFYGKYLWTKGIHNLIAAFPLVLQKHPNSRLIIVGYGTARGYLESLVQALNQGDLAKFQYLLRNPQEFQGQVEEGTQKYSQWLIEQLEDSQFASAYMQAAQGQAANRVIFTGFLDHDLLKDIIPCADVTIAPSIFPEAFGLVGVEALACGVLPLQTYHSGFKYVVDSYAPLFELHPELKKLDKLWLKEDLIENLACNINTILGIYEEKGSGLREQVQTLGRDICTGNYSWDSVAVRFIKEAEAEKLLKSH